MFIGTLKHCPKCEQPANWNVLDWEGYFVTGCAGCGYTLGNIVNYDKISKIRKEGSVAAIQRLLSLLDGAPAWITDQIVFDFCREYGKSPCITGKGQDEKWSRYSKEELAEFGLSDVAH
jgi:hypothetical protein